jgi:hypothetical protein
MTGTPSGSATSSETPSETIASTPSDRYACCSVEPSGTTIRSSVSRYCSTIIQFMS